MKKIVQIGIGAIVISSTAMAKETSKQQMPPNILFFWLTIVLFEI